MTEQTGKNASSSRRGKKAAPQKKGGKAARAAKATKARKAKAEVSSNPSVAGAAQNSHQTETDVTPDNTGSDGDGANGIGADGRGRQSDSDDVADPDVLAIRFLELWRAQVAATAGGSDAASAIGRLYAGLGADTSRLADGFEAWGRLIGQLATGQPPVQNPFSAGAANAAGGMKGTGPNTAQGGGMAPPGGSSGANIWQAAPPDMAGLTALFDPVTAMRNFTAPFNPGMARAPGSTPGAKPQNETLHPPTGPDGGRAPDDATQYNTTGKTETATSQTVGKTANVTQDGEENGQGQPKPATGQSASGRATATGDASGSRDDELAELARRLAALSETINALEAGLDDGSREPASGDGPPQQ
ncbi:hypothetical protein [Thalassospira sp. MCCC 1A01428]|uniref:hypothetical protein n=1 Tax=Thalassospira sp. MCCC 1A01428 TaxID=1470575 RepID=UPI001FEDB6A4|nr:hypothetical protein [Thalassospira sp. MCCC 1A01428]